MPNIIDYYEYAKLASASYVQLDGVVPGATYAGSTIAALANFQNDTSRLPKALAEQTFDPAKNPNPWTIPANGYYGNDPEGFAATFFQRTNTSGVTEKVLAIRGTEPDFSLSGDLLKADIGQIGFLGLALGQAVSMVNYVRLLQAGTGVMVQQLAWNYSTTLPTSGPSIALPNGKGFLFFSNTPAKAGLGLIAPGEQIVVTGHSLGGHVAALAARLFPGLVSAAYTYNAPGFDPVSANTPAIAVSALLNPALGTVVAITGGAALQLTDEFASLIGNYLPVPPAASFGQVFVHTLESEDLDPANDVSIVASVITGAQAVGSEKFVSTERNSHMIEPFMDNLALQALIARMNPGLTLTDMTNLYSVSSNSIPDTQEKILQALYKLFKSTAITVVPVDVVYDALISGLIGIGTGNITGRRDYYDKLLVVEDIVRATSGLSLKLLTSTSRDAMVTEAQRTDATGLAYRYALFELNPFAIIGANYTPHNTTGKLDLYDETTGTGSLTKTYLQDRAAMLTWLNKTYTEDTDIGRVLDGSAWYFKDEASGKQVWVGNPIVKSNPLLRKVIFGQTGADILSGGSNGDHLYGGLGYDVLSGGDGGDYIEGNDGNDTINGETGRDILIGGAGDDTLSGGLDPDRLEGGLGIDTYKYAAGDGFDVIRDLDGLGEIRLDNVALSGGDRRSDNVWQSGDIVYNFSPDVTGRGNLRISRGASTTLMVENFQSGELGINLPSAITSPNLPPASAQPVPVNFNRTTEFNDLIGDGTLYLGQVNGELGDDHLIGSYIDGDSMSGGVGDDRLEGNGGADLLFGGDMGTYSPESPYYNLWLSDLSDNDVLIGGTGGGKNWTSWEFDTVTGIAYEAVDILLDSGGGNDWLIAGELADLAKIKAGLLGQADLFADWLAAGNGDDVLVGSNNGDALFGGGDKDIIYGGAGDDTIHGDDFYSPVSIFWNVLNTDNPFDWEYQVYSKRYPGDQNYMGVSVGTFYKDVGNDDILYGGLGNDRIVGQLGNDKIYGEEGDDLRYGEAANDASFAPQLQYGRRVA